MLSSRTSRFIQCCPTSLFTRYHCYHAITEDVSKQMIPDDDTIADKMMKETNCDHYLRQKADLLNTASNRVTWDGLIIDGAALINILQSGKGLKTFDQYYSNTFASHLT